MNFLILNAGTRNELVKYFTQSAKGKVVATDSYFLAPAIYEADKHYVVNNTYDEVYVGRIIDIAHQENIDCILSLIDPELEFLAKNKEVFNSAGISVMIGDYNDVMLTFNKYMMYKQLSKFGISTIKTYDNLEDFDIDYNKKLINFPVFIKPVCGSGSQGIMKINDYPTLKANYHNHLMIIQEFMTGAEYGVDVYCDMSTHIAHSWFIKKKLKMRSGETDKSVSLHNSRIDELIMQLTQSFKFSGVIDVDIFEHNGKFFVSEINPRFGGGYLHAYACGMNYIDLLIADLEKKPTKKLDYLDEIYMMKFNSIMVKSKEELDE